MAPLKRKRPHSATNPPEPHNPTATATDPVIPRRATRSIAPPLVSPEELEPRRRRRSGTTANDQPPRPELPRGKENIPLRLEQRQQQQHPLKKARITRHTTATAQTTMTTAATPRAPTTGVGADTPLHRPPPTLTPILPPTIPPSALRPPTRPAVGSGSGQSTPLVLSAHQHTVGRTKPITMATSGAHNSHQQLLLRQHLRYSPRPTSSKGGKPDHSGRRGSGHGGSRTGTTETDRNIDKVVLGNVIFRAWYPSYYGKEVLGDVSAASSTAKGGKGGKSGGKPGAGSKTSGNAGGSKAGSKDDATGAKGQGRRDRDNPPMLDRLYVCPCCFKYSKELVSWLEHVRVCERQRFIPGNKIYVHPKGRRTILVLSGPAPKPARGKRASGGQKMVEEVVHDEGEWSVWEVKGEKDVLFCQNLSLFAKLFLDNKSVFFDVTGFNYFLLVHTPPVPPTDPDAEVAEIAPPRSQIVGFFSKEKMSWDNNNLACILIFPPWQRKGLGALLMGISYEISRREGIMGGPEKPISDLGKKGYKRFWAGEIARWLLTLPPSTADEEMVFDVNECSQATWIAPDDCLLVLREMSVAEDAGKGPSRVREPKAEEISGPAAAATAPAATVVETVEVPRVRISQQAVQAWVAKNGISLEKTCDPNGFVKWYAIKQAAEAEVAV